MKDDPEFNITFVSLVRQFPCLYDNTSLDYSSKSLQLYAWETIAGQVNESVLDCKDRWKNLRGCFTRHLKNQTGELAGLRHRKPYYLAQHLSFLLPFTKQRPQITGEYSETNQNDDDTVDEEEEHEDEGDLPEEPEQKYNPKEPEQKYNPEESKNDLEDSRNSMSSSSLKRLEKREPSSEECKFQNNVKKFRWDRTSEDSDLLFLKSLLPDIKEMNPSQKRRLKIGILELCEDITNETNQKFRNSQGHSKLS